MLRHVAPARGTAILVLLCLTILLTAVLAATVQTVAAGAACQDTRERGVAARLVAEAGMEWAVSRLDRDGRFQGVRSRRFGAAEFDVEVATPGDRSDLRCVRVRARASLNGGRTVIETMEAVLRQGADGAWDRVACSFGSGPSR